MNLRLPHRTQQIDRDREKLLGYASDGTTPIHTTAGAHLLSGDEQSELSHNLAQQKRHAAIKKSVDDIMHGAATFFQHGVLNAAPAHIIAEYNAGSEKFVEWLKVSGFTFKQDGLTSVLLHKGREMSTLTAKCDPDIREDVLLMLKLEQGLARGGV